MPIFDIEGHVTAEIGEKETSLMKEKTRNRICGLVTPRGRNDEWKKAFEHIALHFHSRSPRSKEKHTRFLSKYCSESAVKDLVKRAAAAPSAQRIVKLTIGGVPIGPPGMAIERYFGEQIGETPDLDSLIIFVDYQGTLRTAYPVASKKTATIKT